MERDHHGYEIRTQVRERLALSSTLSFGSIYPALARLERQGLVETVTAPEIRPSALSTGSLSGERATLRALRASQSMGRRGRKVYRITLSGRDAFCALLADPATLDDSRSFWVRMALAKHLSAEQLTAILERRRNDLAVRLAELETGARNETLDPDARSVMAHAARGVELDLEWIVDRLAMGSTHHQDLASSAK
jgi:DNA-binding PadR family transcriptional regulator